MTPERPQETSEPRRISPEDIDTVINGPLPPSDRPAPEDVDARSAQVELLQAIEALRAAREATGPMEEAAQQEVASAQREAQEAEAARDERRRQEAAAILQPPQPQ